VYCDCTVKYSHLLWESGMAEYSSKHTCQSVPSFCNSENPTSSFRIQETAADRWEKILFKIDGGYPRDAADRRDLRMLVDPIVESTDYRDVFELDTHMALSRRPTVCTSKMHFVYIKNALIHMCIRYWWLRLEPNFQCTVYIHTNSTPELDIHRARPRTHTVTTLRESHILKNQL